jgi:hypothetical protein
MTEPFFEPTGDLDHFREEEQTQNERDELAHERELDQRYDHEDAGYLFWRWGL